jgi:hypothetical protein
MNEDDLLAIQEASKPFSADNTDDTSGVDPSILAASKPAGGEPTGRLEQVGLGAVEGAATTGATVLGGMAGAKTGMILGAPFGPAGIGIGGVLGLGTGLYAGSKASSSIKELMPPRPTDPALLPYRVAGTTFGDSIAIAPMAFGIPIKGAQQLSTYINSMSPVLANVPGGVASGQLGKFIADTAALIGQTAAKYPKSFLSAEVAGATGAGLGAGVAETVAPGEAGPRLIGEVAGGFLFPGRMVLSASGNAKDFVGTLVQSISKDSREGRAANKLYSILEESGEDIPTLIKKLSKPDVDGVVPSAAQKTGSKTLSVLETTLAKNNAQYGADVLKQGEESLKAYKLLAQRLQDIGTPESLAKAAELRQNYFDGMLDTRLKLADAEAARRVAKITKDTPQSRVQIGDIVKTQTEQALKDAREHERFLWQNAFKDSVETVTKDGKKVLKYKEVTPASVGEEFLNIATSMTPERFKARMPAEVRNIMSRLGIDDAAIKRYADGKQTQEFLDTGRVPAEYLMRTKPAPKSSLILPPGVKPTIGAPEQTSIFKDTNVNDLINIRSDLLAFARDSAARGEAANANFYGRLAESTLNDLDTLSSPAYDGARQFSRTLNDTFTRTYAGDVATGVTKTGAEKIPAEILVSRAFGSNADVTALRMQEIQDAVGMMRTQYDDVVARFGPDSAEAMQLKPFADLATQRVDSIGDAQQRVLRLAAAKTIDPVTGRVNQKQLTNFVNENRAMLDKFGVTNDLQDTLKAENAFQSISQQNSYANKTLRKETAFAQVLQSENPTRAVTDVLSSRYPVKNFTNVVKLAKEGGPEAVDGLKSIIYDYAFTKAGGMDKFDVTKFRAALFEPLAKGQPSVLNMMRSQGLISNTEVKNLLSIIRPMEKVEKAMGTKQMMDEVVQGADAVTELAMRVVGARIGTAASGGGPGALIAASAGSKAVRNIFDKAPTMMIRGIIEQATKDPQLMAMLLKKGVTEGDRIQMARQLHGYLGAAGLNYAEFEEPPPEQQAPARPGPSQSQQMLRTLPPAPQTRGMPNATPAAPPAAQGPQGAPATAPAPAPGPQGAAPQPPTQSRQMLAALFPEDRLLQGVQ